MHDHRHDPPTPPTNATRQSAVFRSVYQWQVWLCVVALVFLAYAGASYYIGGYARQLLQSYVDNERGVGPFKIVIAQHEQGIFKSSGSMTVQHMGLDDRGEAAALQVHYQIHHALWPQRLASISWRAQPQTVASVSPDSLLSHPPRISATGEGQVTWSGSFEGQLAMPALERVPGRQPIATAPLRGDVRITLTQQQWVLYWPWVELNDAVPAWRLEEVRWSFDSAQQHPMKQQLQVQRFDWPSERLQAQALEVILNNPQSFADRVTQPSAANSMSLPMSLNWQVRASQVAFEQYEAHDVVLEGELQGLRPDSLRGLMLTVGQQMGWLRPDALESHLRQSAMRQVLLDGLSLRLSQMAWRSSWGNLQGQATLTIAPLPSEVQQTLLTQAIAWEPYLASRGEFHLQGLAPSLTGLGMLTGILVRAPQGVKTGFDYRDGQLKINGRPSAVMIARPLGLILNRWLNQWARGSDVETQSLSLSKPSAEAYPLSLP